MPRGDKFQCKLHCICNQLVVFDLVGSVECDCGSHTVIQCPKCQELFSIDKACPAFASILDLSRHNPTLYSDKEQAAYLVNSHISQHEIFILTIQKSVYSNIFCIKDSFYAYLLGCSVLQPESKSICYPTSTHMALVMGSNMYYDISTANRQHQIK